jgi:N-acetylneuraminic acid mutarotase
MHAGHDHGGGDAVNPAGSVFVDAGNVKAAFTESGGSRVWATDAFVAGGKNVRGKFPVAGTEDDALFASRRQGKLIAYTVTDLADGAYTLSMLFVDTVKKPGKRMFNVFAEGERIESDLDIVARTGARRTALTLNHQITVDGGVLELELAKGSKGVPVISAFSLVPVGSTGQAPQAPAAPANLAATAASPTGVNVTWVDVSGLESGFEIERSTDGGMTFVPLVTVPANATGYADASGVGPNQTYHYRIRAVSNAAGGLASPWTGVAAVTTPAQVANPGAPAAPSDLAAAVLSPTSIALSWADNATNETSIVVERSTGGQGFEPLATLPSDTTSYRDDAAGSGTAYLYRVRAANPAGASDPSNEAAAATPGVAPVAPAGLVATVVSGTEIRLAWADNSGDETGFVLERMDDGRGEFVVVATLGAGATQHADTTVTPGHGYAYRVRATGPGGESAPSAEASAATPVGPVVDTFTKVTWDTRAASPIVRAESLGGAVGGKLYVFGGFSGDEGPVKRSDAYDPATNTWTRIADMPTRLTHAGTVIDGRNFYFAGGYVGTGPAYTQVFATKDVWQYNVDANQYTKLPDLPQARGAGGLVQLGRKLHYFGGGDLARADRAEHFVLDLDNKSAGWTTAAALPDARTHMGYAALGGKIYAIGGHTGLHEGLIPTTQVTVWDPASPDAWQEVKSLPGAVSHVGASTLVTGGRIVVLGGERGDGKWISEVIAYDPTANTWTRLTDLPGKKFSGVAGVIDEVFYFTTGGNSTTTYRGMPG